MTAYQLGRAHAQASLEKSAAGLRKFPSGPLLPRLLTRLGKMTRRGLWHLEPGMVPGRRASDLGAITAGLGLGTVGSLMGDSSTPPPPSIQQGFLPPGTY